MHKENDFIVYKHDVCKIKEVRNNMMNGNTYYIMTPIDDESLIIDVPTDNRMGWIRDLLTLEEANKLIDRIPNIKPLSNINDKNIENTYKELLTNGSHDELIQIIKTSYLRNEERINNKKKISDKDDKYFKLAEKYLYNELSIILNKSFDETREYIINKVQENKG